MRRARSGFLSFVFVSAFSFVSFVGTDSRAETSDDPWLGRDKVIHYGVSAGIAATGYAAGALIFDGRAPALGLGGGVAALAGVGKELADLGGYGDPSWKDLCWDGLGIVSGLAVAWGVDLLVRGVSAEHPLFARIRGGIAF